MLSCFIAQAVSSRPGRALARSGLLYRQRPLLWCGLKGDTSHLMKEGFTPGKSVGRPEPGRPTLWGRRVKLRTSASVEAKKSGRNRGTHSLAPFDIGSVLELCMSSLRRGHDNLLCTVIFRARGWPLLSPGGKEPWN